VLVVEVVVVVTSLAVFKVVLTEERLKRPAQLTMAAEISL